MALDAEETVRVEGTVQNYNLLLDYLLAAPSLKDVLNALIAI